MKQSALLVFTILSVAVSSGLTAAVTTNAFYVATDGSDSKPGTLASPFATLSRCQEAMRASRTNKTCYIRAGNYHPPVTGNYCVYGHSAGSSIGLGPMDSGETWSYYPPDGYGSAVLDGQSTAGGSGKSGGNGTGCAFGDNNAASVTINGLQFENYQFSAFWGHGASSLTFVNNTVHNLTSAIWVAAGVALVDSPDSVVRNNYFYDLAYVGVGLWEANGNNGGESNTTIANNVVINSCTWPAVSGGGNDQNGGDCGAIYIARQMSPSRTNIRIMNNYVRDVNMSSNGAGNSGHCCAMGIYLDDGASNVTVSGNVTAGKISACFHIHGGNDNVIKGNICDLDHSGSQSILFFQPDKHRFPMTGNVFANNIVISDSSDEGRGYAGGLTPNRMMIRDNSYFNYGGRSIRSSGIAGAGSDTNPKYENPHFNCWTYSLDSGSPVYHPPVNFPHQPENWGQPGFWGPPGFLIPHTGTPPSGCRGPSRQS
jgi:hypothetical protein